MIRLWSISDRPSITVPSTAQRSPGRSSTMSPGWIAATGTCGNFVGPDELGRGLGLERGEISGDRACSPPHALVEIAPYQQECQQHDRRIEIGMLGVVHGLDDRHAQRKNDADADRNIHIDVARAQRAKRRPEEGLARIGRGRQRDQRRQPVEEIALFGNHVADSCRTTPESKASSHSWWRMPRRRDSAAESAIVRLPRPPRRRFRTDRPCIRARRAGR